MRPILIGGCGRSGTTLLGSMLGAHPDVVCTPESQFKTWAFREHDLDSADADLASVFQWITNHRRFRLWGIEAGSIQANFDGGYRGLLESIVRRYGETTGTPNPKIWVDHTPDNIEQAHAMLDVFPETQFIHLIRDGRGVAASVIPLDWGPNGVDDAAAWWASKLAFGLAAESNLRPDQIIRVRYEDLIRHPEAELQRVCGWTGVSFEDSMTRSSGFQPPKYTTAQHQLVTSPPQASRAEAWRKRLSEREIEIFESRVHGLLIDLGYAPSVGLRARGATRGERRRSELKQVVRKAILNKLRKRLRRMR